MATTEPTINDALASVLRLTRSRWRAEGVVRSENTAVLRGAGLKPDILISEPNVSPVIIETEGIPAASVESDALQRLGQQLKTTGAPILSSLAIRMPASLRKKVVMRSGTKSPIQMTSIFVSTRGKIRPSTSAGHAAGGSAEDPFRSQYSPSQLQYRLR